MDISQILCSNDESSPEETPVTSPARHQSKWSNDEDIKVIQLRGSGLKWEDVAKELPGRSDMACRLHYQNYLEKNIMWDDNFKNKFANTYARHRKDIWSIIGRELGIPWKNAEIMYHHLGAQELAARAGSLYAQSLSGLQTSPTTTHFDSPPNAAFGLATATNAHPAYQIQYTPGYMHPGAQVPSFSARSHASTGSIPHQSPLPAVTHTLQSQRTQGTRVKTRK